MLDPKTRIYDRNGKRVSAREFAKVRPGEMYGFSREGSQVWNEDAEEGSGSQSQGPDDDFFNAVKDSVGLAQEAGTVGADKGKSKQPCLEGMQQSWWEL